jgi:hypothetical protein
MNKHWIDFIGAVSVVTIILAIIGAVTYSHISDNEVKIIQMQCVEVIKDVE